MIKLVKFGLVAFFMVFLSACAVNELYHENVMRGQVVGLDKEEVILCIGRKDGAKEGMELQVLRYSWADKVIHGEYDEYGGDVYKTDYVGTVKIKSVVNEHFARAVITKGDVKKHDIVELRQ